jgi:hypothetical protein
MLQKYGTKNEFTWKKGCWLKIAPGFMTVGIMSLDYLLYSGFYSNFYSSKAPNVFFS